MRPEGMSQLKLIMMPSGIESATFRLVARCYIILESLNKTVIRRRI